MSFRFFSLGFWNRFISTSSASLPKISLKLKMWYWWVKKNCISFFPFLYTLPFRSIYYWQLLYIKSFLIKRIKIVLAWLMSCCPCQVCCTCCTWCTATGCSHCRGPKLRRISQYCQLWWSYRGSQRAWGIVKWDLVKRSSRLNNFLFLWSFNNDIQQ